jgi:allantoate deiminase
MREAGFRIAKCRDLSFTWDEIGDVASVHTDKSFSEMLAAAVRESGVTVREMVSGAGHDVVALAPSMPTCLLFIRCRGGISHHPDESVEPADVAIALEVMHNFVRRLGSTR